MYKFSAALEKLFVLATSIKYC